VDGFTFPMPDTPENQTPFPQIAAQRPGVGPPVARACIVLSLATAATCKLALGPYEGKETGEHALLRELLESTAPAEVAVFDRYHCFFMMLALLSFRCIQVCIADPVLELFQEFGYTVHVPRRGAQAQKTKCQTQHKVRR
jgi:putative transposase